MDALALGGLVVGGVAGSAALLQFTQTRKAGQVGAYLAIVRSVQEESVREARAQLFHLARTKPYERWSQEDKLVAGRAIHPYATVAEMVAMRLVQFVHVATWGYSILECRAAAGPYIRERREQSPALWQDLDRLCERLQHPRRTDRLRWLARYPRRKFPDMSDTTRHRFSSGNQA